MVVLNKEEIKEIWEDFEKLMNPYWGIGHEEWPIIVEGEEREPNYKMRILRVMEIGTWKNSPLREDFFCKGLSVKSRVLLQEEPFRYLEKWFIEDGQKFFMEDGKMECDISKGKDIPTEHRKGFKGVDIEIQREEVQFYIETFSGMEHQVCGKDCSIFEEEIYEGGKRVYTPAHPGCPEAKVKDKKAETRFKETLFHIITSYVRNGKVFIGCLDDSYESIKSLRERLRKAPFWMECRYYKETLEGFRYQNGELFRT